MHLPSIWWALPEPMVGDIPVSLTARCWGRKYFDLQHWRAAIEKLAPAWKRHLAIGELALVWQKSLNVSARNIKQCGCDGVYPIQRKLYGLSTSLHNSLFNTLGPRQNGRHFTDDIFKCISLNEDTWIPFKISLKFVPNGPIDNCPGDKPLSEPMMVSLLMHMGHSASMS